jgi:hypothetical protein
MELGMVAKAVISILEKVGQKDSEFKASLGYIWRLCFKKQTNINS